MADGTHAPVRGSSEGRRQPVSLSPSKPAPDFPFLARGVFPKEREAGGSKGHIPRRAAFPKARRCPLCWRGAHPSSPPVLGCCAGSISGFPAAGPDLGTGGFGSRPALLGELV